MRSADICCFLKHPPTKTRARSERTAPFAFTCGVFFATISRTVQNRDTNNLPEISTPRRGGVTGRILVVDDELSVRKMYRALLEGEGYTVTTARDGSDALAKFAEIRPDLVLLDVMMPRMNGTAACAEMRKLDALVPILFFTAMPSDVGAVRALGFGADDYIDKAKSPEEILARVASALRRRAAARAEARPSNLLHLGSLTVDFASTSAEGPDVKAKLTRIEVGILRLLASGRGRLFSFDDIRTALYGEGYTADDMAIHSAMYRLKHKLGGAGSLIASERGFGYRLIW